MQPCLLSFNEFLYVSVIEEIEWSEEEIQIEQIEGDTADLSVMGEDEFTIEIPRLETNETIDVFKFILN